MKIAITNTVLSNTGDAAICLSIVDLLRDRFPGRELDFTVFDSDAPATRALYPSLTIVQQVTATRPFRPGKASRLLSRFKIAVTNQIARNSRASRLAEIVAQTFFGKAFRTSLAALRDADLVVSSGGTYLVDHYDFTVRAVELELARRLGKTIVLWTQSVGPFATDRSFRNACRIAAVADAVFFRDQKSLEAWQRLTGHKEGQEQAVAADSVFGLRVENATPVGALESIFMSVRRWGKSLNGEDSTLANYPAAMRELALRADRDHRMVALSTCQGVPTYGYDDSQVAQDFFDGLNVEVNQDFHTPQELHAELLGARVVVATRMHFAILSMLAGVPVIAIAYEFKTVELFKSLGLENYCVAIDEVTGEWLTSRVEEALTNAGRVAVPPAMMQNLRESAAQPAASTAIARAINY